MRSLILSVVLLILSTSAMAKVNSFIGWINADGKKIKFSINYTITSNNLITGTSITAQGTKDETKCKIKGKYNRRTGGIYFYETVVISSKAKYENLNFCLLSAKLKKRSTAKEIIYSGRFTGYVRGTKRKCATGSMLIKKKRPQTIKPVVKKLKPVKTTKPQTTQRDILYSNIKSKKMVQYHHTTNNATLEIWDDIQPDGDRVSIYLDGKNILNGYELLKTKKQILLSLKGSDKHTLKIVADNEGKASPNTSRIRLHLGNIQKELTAHVQEKDFIYIVLTKD